jgi:hypothetical protein
MVTGRLSVSFVVGLLNTEYTVFGFRKVNITGRNRSHFPPISTGYSQPQYQILQIAEPTAYCCSSRGHNGQSSKSDSWPIHLQD